MLTCGPAHLVFYRILTYMSRYILKLLKSVMTRFLLSEILKLLMGQSIQNQVTLGGDPLGFSLFLDMLIHTIKELIMHNYSSVPQTVPEIWLTHISAGHKGPIS